MSRILLKILAVQRLGRYFARRIVLRVVKYDTAVGTEQMRPTGGVATVEPVVAHHFTTDRDGRDLGYVAVMHISVFGRRPDSRHFTSVVTTPLRLHCDTNPRSPECTGL